ncbi:hypothetical protein NOR51B_343 [Luminiphilus syltensis NOR5-1B]|uniref:Uncharacterized protein n=1 Tax=Luminiphilus syltensis NOR5-1B TaxID=565045 RepID=B8KSR0_9GAMM|nr:hypothetical protein NOR51B_343 [Luminiphilus syltensis NOR5-1B]
MFYQWWLVYSEQCALREGVEPRWLLAIETQAQSNEGHPGIRTPMTQ